LADRCWKERTFGTESTNYAGGEDWLADAAAIVLPAWVEHQPRRLLQAVAAGVPVIATTACGLANVPGVTTIPTGNAVALRNAIESVFSGVGA